MRAGLWNPKEQTPRDGLRQDLMSFEKLVEEEETQVNGVVAIMNAENMGWEHIRAFDSNASKISMKVMQESFPLRFKGIYIVNEPGLLDVLLTMVRPFMSAKTLSRITFVGSDLSKLHQIFDPAILPEELGGDLPSGDVLAKDWCKKMMASEAMFADMAQYKIETTKSIGKTKDNASTATNVGAGGTFRKLNVD